MVGPSFGRVFNNNENVGAIKRAMNVIDVFTCKLYIASSPIGGGGEVDVIHDGPNKVNIP